jgi:hypothetical protein
MTNPFGSAAPAAAAGTAEDPFGGKDPFASAKATFAGIADVRDCLVLVYPLEHLTGLKSTMNSETYDAVVCDVVILDGAPAESLDVTELPHRHPKMRINGSAVVPQLTPYVDPKGGRMVLGRVQGYFSDKYAKKGGKQGGTEGFKLLEPTEEDKVVARRYLAGQLLAQNAPAS